MQKYSSLEKDIMRISCLAHYQVGDSNMSCMDGRHHIMDQLNGSKKVEDGIEWKNSHATCDQPLKQG